MFFIFFIALLMCSSCATIASVEKNTLTTDSIRTFNCMIVIKLPTINNSVGLVQNVFNQVQNEFAGYEIEYVQWSESLGGIIEIKVKIQSTSENPINVIIPKLHDLPNVVGVIINKD